MNYTPDEIAHADQNLAGITRQLDRLVEQTKDPIVTIDELGVILVESMNEHTLAVTLAVAVHKLAGR